MKNKSTLNCMEHNNVNECPDVLIKYNSKFDEYGLKINDGGSSVLLINFCPFCGLKLPESKRDEWFSVLENMGFNEPTEEKIPDEFNSSEWYKNKNL